MNMVLSFVCQIQPSISCPKLHFTKQTLVTKALFGLCCFLLFPYFLLCVHKFVFSFIYLKRKGNLWENLILKKTPNTLSSSEWCSLECLHCLCWLFKVTLVWKIEHWLRVKRPAFFFRAPAVWEGEYCLYLPNTLNTPCVFLTCSLSSLVCLKSLQMGWPHMCLCSAKPKQGAISNRFPRYFPNINNEKKPWELLIYK